MRTAFVRGHGVQLIEDQCARRLQRLAPALRRQQDVQRLRRRNQHVRGPFRVERPLLRRRVAGADGDPYLRVGEAHLLSELGDLGKRLEQVALDIVRKRLQRRDIDDLRPAVETVRERLPHEAVEGGEERGERLSGARWRSDERMAARSDRRPSLRLRLRRRPEAPLEPRSNQRMKALNRHVAALHAGDILAHDASRASAASSARCPSRVPPADRRPPGPRVEARGVPRGLRRNSDRRRRDAQG